MKRSTTKTARAARLELDFRAPLSETGWYHSMEFPDGSFVNGYHSLPDLQQRWAEFDFPEDLTGKRVLDIGAWDGWFSFEAERRGADVVALDYVEVENFLFAHKKLNSKVQYVIAEVYDLPRLNLGRFHYVLFLGVLYHLRHPLLALEYVCAATSERAIVDSFVVSGDKFSCAATHDLPYMEFYETDELGSNIDNWVGPTPACLLAFCRSAGFVEVKLLSITHRHARITCSRKWHAKGKEGKLQPILEDAQHSVNYGLNFSSGRDEYLSCWFQFSGPVTLADVYPEVAEFGATPLFLKQVAESRWLCNFRLPPGLEPGWHDVRVRVSGSSRSNPLQIAMDLPVTPGALHINGVFDGVDWRPNHLSIVGKSLVLWAGGLSENCDKSNIRLYLGERKLRISFIGPLDAHGLRQINAELTGALAEGTSDLHLRHSDQAVEGIKIEVS